MDSDVNWNKIGSKCSRSDFSRQLNCLLPRFLPLLDNGVNVCVQARFGKLTRYAMSCW